MKTSCLLLSLLVLFIFHGLEAQSTYSVVYSSTDNAHSYYTALLRYDGNETSYINATNMIVQNLNFTYIFVSERQLVVRITDPDNQRWEVPYSPPFPHANLSQRFAPYDNAPVKIVVTESPFSFKLIKTSSNEVIFDTSVGDFIYTDYYLQFSTSLTTPNIYGLGERAAPLNLGPDGTYSIFTKDNPGDIEDGTSGNNLYGYHPVYLLREQSNQFHMALLRSSVPMDVIIEQGNTLTYKVIGGVIDLNFFFGEDSDQKPETIVKQYHSFLGTWVLQPFWSLGFHQSRWGYKSVQDLTDVLSNYTQYGLPLDVIWSDINYMDAYIDFTIDTVNFPPNQMRQMLQEYQKRWVPIIDAGVAINNKIYDIGFTNNVYLHDPNGTNLLGVVWPGEVNYPDFFDPNASMFWDIGLNFLYQEVPFAGIWTDMNEASNFVPGEVGFVANVTDILNNPPYKPAKSWEEIYTKTERMDAVHNGGIYEYYVHSMFGFLETKATYNFLKVITDLVFILTRSSFYGSGQYTAHWTGDNDATYQYMGLSIPGIINSGLFGMPLVGSDICGFMQDTTPELCARWFQLGALYPFSRNHNDNTSISQEPYALGPTVLETAKVSLELRYSIVRHYYTQFLKQNGTGTVFKPLFFEFPTDANLFDLNSNITDNQFLVGEALMAAPALTEGVDSVSVYFPQDTWFDFSNGDLMQTSQEVPTTITYPAPLNATVPLFIRGNYIVPVQNVTGVNRTDDLSNLYQLVIAFKETGAPNAYHAQGDLPFIKNFDDANVLTKCRHDNCLYSVNADINVSDEAYNLTISFNAQGTPAHIETVGISSLFMMGDWPSQKDLLNEIHQYLGLNHNMNGVKINVEEVSSNVIKYVFDKPVFIKNGDQIKISSKTIDI